MVAVLNVGCRSVHSHGHQSHTANTIAVDGKLTAAPPRVGSVNDAGAVGPSVLPWGQDGIRIRIPVPGHSVDVTDAFGAFAHGAPRPPQPPPSPPPLHLARGQQHPAVQHGALTVEVTPTAVHCTRTADRAALFSVTGLTFSATRYPDVYEMNLSTTLSPSEQVSGFGQHQVGLTHADPQAPVPR
jgi:hypothetical protein